MELTARIPLAANPALRRRVDLPAFSAWALPFALITYLALHDGGYDTVVRSEIGVALWWVLLLAALAGVLPARIGRAGWVAIGLLACFAIWTGIGVTWTESKGNTVIEIGREATYLGVLVLAIAIQGRTEARHTINGLACAIGFVTVLSVLSRLHPEAFPVNAQFQFLGASAGRKLSYPLNYWNALAAFAAIGVPLLAGVAVGGRTVAGRAFAAATIPLSALCVYLTISRGGVLELGAGVVVFVVLFPRRLQAMLTLAISGAGAAILVGAASARGPLESGLRTPVALHQGTLLLVLAIITCAGVGLTHAALTLAIRHSEDPARPPLTRQRATRMALAACALAVLVAIAAGVPGAIEHQWHNFKQPPGAVAPGASTNVFSRLTAINGDSRYQFWQASVHADATAPLTGIGPGTFQFWWAQHGTTLGFVRNAHSLYFETLAETGIIGITLLGGLFLWLCVVAVQRTLRASTATRIWIAAAAGGLFTFMTAAALDWVWQFAAIAAIALILGAVIVAGRGKAPVRRPVDGGLISRFGIAGLSIAALLAIAIPLAGAVALQRSQTAAAAGNLPAAYQDSLTAQRLQPYAAAPRLQEALVLEAAHEYVLAAGDARAATIDEPDNWENWLTLARIDAERGAYAEGVAALDQARRLNPRSSLFTTPLPPA